MQYLHTGLPNDRRRLHDPPRVLPGLGCEPG